MQYSVKEPNDILIHTVNQHETGGKFSLRQRIFDESIGHYAYRSIHFAIDIIKLKENHKKGYISNVNCEEKNISFKRKLKVETDCCEFQTDTIHTDKWTQTDFSELYSILPDDINVLKEMQRYDDFVTVTKCIRERILTENIAFHLLLDIGNFYSKDSINALGTVMKLLNSG